MKVGKLKEGQISSELAEQERDHGCSVWAAMQDLSASVTKFHRIPSQWEGSRLLCLGNPIVKAESIILNNKMSVSCQTL